MTAGDAVSRIGGASSSVLIASRSWSSTSDESSEPTRVESDRVGEVDEVDPSRKPSESSSCDIGGDCYGEAVGGWKRDMGWWEDLSEWLEERVGQSGG